MEKYLFETSFDVEQPPPAPEEEVVPPTVYSEEELATAESASFVKGHAEGLDSALQGIEQTTAQALTAIAAQLEAAAGQQAEANERCERQSLQAAVTILRKLFPESARRHALDEVEGTLAACLATLHDEPRVVVRTAADLVDTLSERIDPLAEASGFAGKIALLPDETLSPSDVRVEWADGGVERDTGRLWDEVERILAATLGDSPAETVSPAAAAARQETDTPEPDEAQPSSEPVPAAETAA